VISPPSKLEYLGIPFESKTVFFQTAMRSESVFKDAINGLK